MSMSSTYKAISSVWEKAICIPLEVKSLKWVVFSDHHRGRRDGADDFSRCEPAYINALNHYYDKGYTLVLLGDVEEFWENPFRKVINSYAEVLSLEKKFYDEGRMIKLWGNHDDDWQFPLFINSKLKKYFPKIVAHEGVSVQLKSEGENLGQILLLHGHQGTKSSDKFAGISKFFVRYFWRYIQIIFKVPLSSPSNDMGLKSKHDKEMYEWAKSKTKQVVVCGHTHQPVFLSRTHLDELEIKKKEVLKNSGENLEEEEIQKVKEIEATKDSLKGATHLNVSNENISPCYFNTGCCSFSDGDITGLEFIDSGINLVKWNSEKRVQHRTEDWHRIFKEV